MSNIDFSSPTFSSSMPEPKKSSSNRTVLLACGGCLVLFVLACCCCLVIGIFALRQPVGLATFWGGVVSLEDNESIMDMIVCEDSQAKVYTDQLRLQGATFNNFSVSQEAGDDVTATGDLEINGQVTAWEATFFTGDGGLFGRCIDRIEVTSGGVTPGANNPFTTPTPSP